MAENAPIDGVGVGSNVDTSADSPFLDSAYKLHYFRDRPRGKHAEGKTDLPGRKQIFRRYDANGSWLADTLGLLDERVDGEPLLEPVMRHGERISAGSASDLESARARCAQALAALPNELKTLRQPPEQTVTLSPGLKKLREELAQSYR
jgi:nicotinate phosphoribosyltransferase